VTTSEHLELGDLISGDGHGDGHAESRVERLTELVASLLERNAQLEQALESRIAIEQAKGVLAERFDLPMDEAFELLRRAARSSRRKLQEVAVAVASSRVSPPEVSRILELRP
jgi:hypothetical protein